MNPLKLLRRLLGIVRGGAGAVPIVLGCVLGLMIGMNPGLNLTLGITVLLFLLLNANFGLAVVGIVVGKVLCLVLARVTFEIGYVVIHHLGLEGLFRAVSETPVVALMDLHRYCLVGGLVVAVVLGAVVGVLVTRMVNGIRSAVVAGLGKSAAMQRVSRNAVVRLLLWVLLGKQKRPLAEMLGLKDPVLRRSGLVLTLVVVLLVAGFEVLFADRVAAWGLKEGLEAAVGAEVDIEGVDLSLMHGSLAVRGVGVTDPSKPAFNMAQVFTLACDVNVASLLAGRLVVDEMVIKRFEQGVKRDSPGQVYVTPKEPPPPPPNDAVSNYFEQGQRVLEYLYKLRRYLAERQKGQDRTDPQKREPAGRDDLKRWARERGYLALTATPLLVRRPGVTIRSLRIEDIPVGGTDTWNIEAKELSDKPELNERAMTFTVGSNKGLSASVTFDFTKPGARHTVKLHVPKLNLGEDIRLTDRVPVNIREAEVSVSAEGTFTNETIALPVVIQLRNMKAGGRAGTGVLGLDAATTAKVFQAVANMSVVAELYGPIATPRVRVDSKNTLSSLQKALQDAGQRLLADQAGAQIQKLADSTGIKLPPDLQKATPADVIGGIGSLLGKDKGKGKQEKGNDKAGKKKEKKKTLLEGLFR